MEKKKPAAKKSGAKKSGAKKPAAKKSAAKKSGAKKSAAKKSGAKESAAKKSGAKKSAAKKSGAKKSAAKKPAMIVDLVPLERALRGVATILRNTYGEAAVEALDAVVRVRKASVPSGIPALPAAELVVYAIDQGLVVAATLELDLSTVVESRLLEVLADNNSQVPIGTFALLPQDRSRLMFKVGLPGVESELPGTLLADALAWVQTVSRNAHRFLPEELGISQQA